MPDRLLWKKSTFWRSRLIVHKTPSKFVPFEFKLRFKADFHCCVFHTYVYARKTLNPFKCYLSNNQTAEYVRFRQDLGGGKLKNLGAGAEKCPRGGLRSGLALGGQPPKGQSALLKQEESGKYTSTRMLPISMGG